MKISGNFQFCIILYKLNDIKIAISKRKMGFLSIKLKNEYNEWIVLDHELLYLMILTNVIIVIYFINVTINNNTK